MIVRSKFLGSELLVAVLAHFPVSRFRMTDTEDLVRALHTVKVRANHQYDDYFTNYPIDDAGRLPESRALSEGLSSLQHTTLLSCEPPYLVNFSISDSLRRYFVEHVSKKVSSADAPRLRSFSEAVFVELKAIAGPS